jgi:ectoine hydroxylase-related dioxygenase (phytanoyl-CoA dioxygenase family)
MALTSAVFHALDRDGYAVLPALLDSAQRQRLLRAFEAASTQEHGTQHVRLTDTTPERADWTALTTHPAVLAAAEHVLKTAFHVRDIHWRNPLPGFGQQGLHSDSPQRSQGSPYIVVTALWMLDAFTEQNGATRVVPGTHLDPRPLPKPLAQPHARHAREQLIIGAAGSVLVLNGHIWHSGTQNRSDGPRRAVQMVIERLMGGGGAGLVPRPSTDVG